MLKNRDFLVIVKIHKHTRETSETCSGVTTSDLKTIWELHVTISGKTCFSTLKWAQIWSRATWPDPNQAAGSSPFERASKIITISISDDGFGDDLMYGNFVQRGLRLLYWRTPSLAVWRPMRSQRRVLRTTCNSAKPWRNLYLGHSSWVEERGCEALSSHNWRQFWWGSCVEVGCVSTHDVKMSRKSCFYTIHRIW